MHGRTLGMALAVLLALPAAVQATSTNCAGFQALLTTPPVDNVITLTEDCTGSFTTAASGVTIEGDLPNASRILTASSGRALTWSNAGNSTLRNLSVGTLAGGFGGVAFTGNSTPTVDLMRFVENDNPGAFSDGGALSITSTAGPGGTVTVQNSAFGGGLAVNSAGRSGGGLYVFSSTGVTVLLDGLSLQGNHARLGGGVFVQSNGGHVTLRNSTFFGNYVTGADLAGGAAYLGGLDVTVSGNSFDGNQARLDSTTPAVALGGALYASGSETAGGATLTANTFSDNAITLGDGSLAVTMQGGAAQLNGVVALLRNRWTGNTLAARSGVASGGALGLGGACGGAQPVSTLRNELFRDNAIAGTAQGADVYLGSCSIDVDNITASGATVGSGTASIFAPGGATVDLANSILWGTSGGSADLTAGTAVVRFSDVCAAGAPFAGTGNICADPLFADAEHDMIQAGSPVVETGSNDLVPAGLTNDLFMSPRLIDANLDCTATVDMGAIERGVSGICNAPVVPTPTPSPTPSPAPTPSPTPTVTPPVITDPGQVLLCEGRKVVLIDIRRQGASQVLRGLSLKSLAGKKVKIVGDHGAGTVTARIAKDGSFTATVPNPKSDQTSYVARYGKDRSVPLKVSRNLFVVLQKKVAGGLRIVARHSRGGRVKGESATLLRQTACGVQSKGGTAKFDKRGQVTFLLKTPTPPDTVAVYRVTTKVNQTFTLPIVVRR